jgi:hypothetical protein
MSSSRLVACFHERVETGALVAALGAADLVLERCDDLPSGGLAIAVSSRSWFSVVWWPLLVETRRYKATRFLVVVISGIPSLAGGLEPTY